MHDVSIHVETFKIHGQDVFTKSINLSPTPNIIAENTWVKSSSYNSGQVHESASEFL